MHKSVKTLLLPGLLILGAVGIAHSEDDKADSFNKALDKMCDKTMQCMIEEMKQEEDLPPEMEQMAQSMIQGVKTQCKQSMTFASNIVDPTIYKKMEACIEEMSESTCEELMNEPEWPACDEYEKYVESLDMQ